RIARGGGTQRDVFRRQREIEKVDLHLAFGAAFLGAALPAGVPESGSVTGAPRLTGAGAGWFE
ncbi:hypothetical protein ACQ1Y8_14850, partial [Enterococcus faecalis]|uniref:hypothetical protein n=1 Tax=Enterococcus faecalis TaxID=1351 RepID=UPI003D6B8D60